MALCMWAVSGCFTPQLNDFGMLIIFDPDSLVKIQLLKVRPLMSMDVGR